MKNTDLSKEVILSPEKIEVNNKDISKRYVTILLGIVAIALLFGLQSFYEKYYQKEPVKENEKISEEIDTSHQGLVQSPPEEVVENEEPAEQMPPILGLSIEIIDVGKEKEACWMEIYADSQLIFEGTLSEKEIKKVEAKEKIKITLGNAGVAKLTIGEKDLGTLGKIGQVLTKEFTLADLQ